jgi:hypothetical protein
MELFFKDELLRKAFLILVPLLKENINKKKQGAKRGSEMVERKIKYDFEIDFLVANAREIERVTTFVHKNEMKLEE